VRPVVFLTSAVVLPLKSCALQKRQSDDDERISTVRDFWRDITRLAARWRVPVVEIVEGLFYTGPLILSPGSMASVQSGLAVPPFPLNHVVGPLPVRLFERAVADEARGDGLCDPRPIIACLT
jgi:hypothetical protein